MSETRSATRWTVPNCSIHCALAFSVLAQLCGPKANESEMGVALFTKNDEERNFDVDFDFDFFLEEQQYYIFTISVLLLVDFGLELFSRKGDYAYREY